MDEKVLFMAINVGFVLFYLNPIHIRYTFVIEKMIVLFELSTKLMNSDMKKIVCLLIICLLCSCNKEEEMMTIDQTAKPLTEQDALKSFAKVLSIAVSRNESLREYIKEKSLEQFDKDYDVFYPFVKNDVLPSGITFKEALLEACESPDLLSSIEVACPKLNILVPDWSWIGSFKADYWDTSKEDILVGYAQKGDSHTLFKNGESFLELSLGEIPDTPTLIVKENERMKVISTRSSEGVEYDFIDNCFDGRNTTETRGRTWYEDDILLNYEEINDFVPSTDIDPLLISAYNEFGNNYSGPGCQRDYVYFGMSNNNQNNGILNSNIRERFYRFKINPDSYNYISDQDQDPSLSDPITKYGRSHQLSAEELMNRIWSGGNFDFRFDFYIGQQGVIPTSTIYYYICSKTASEVFDLTKVHRKYKHQTAVAQGEYIYSFLAENLVPKWVYMPGDVYLPEWDISNRSNNIIIAASELDPSETRTETYDVTFTYSNNFSISTGGEASIGLDNDNKIKISLGVKDETHNQHTENNKIVVQTSYASDSMGAGQLPYSGKIVIGPDTKTINGTLVNGYSIKPVDFGSFSITFLPTDIR